MPSPREPSGEFIARQVQEKGIDDARTLAAIRRVPRPRFLPPEVRSQALEDAAVPIGQGQTISQPYMVAAMTALLDVRPEDRVLEIGTGSGYQTAILSLMARMVYTVERQRDLSLRARGVLEGFGVTNVRYLMGDGTLGWPEHAPYDRILVTAGAPALPRPLFDQLAEGGILVAPLGGDEVQHLSVIRKQAGQPVERREMSCRFVKLIGEQGWSETP
ncbi:protein-L-isoaspartate(D-aspartate) O-methyltransferase [Tundrisphaera sp. TA3]|uniref:protein-L-isoaspartate(D-aspartate) O-methyltransferase n=1 Tax=Tundrisphaera sp. TA3 TaxID=3435775 RepID=UPI003EBF5CBB